MSDKRPEPSVASIVGCWPGDLLDLTLVVFDQIDSTQRFARKLVERLLAEWESPRPTLVVALEQSAGRGRRGRRWESRRGRGLWATLVSPVESERLATVPARAAVALAEVVRVVVPMVAIKWPNDLVLDRRKLGGIVVEAIVRGASPGWILVGFGIDLDHTEEELPEPRALSLALAATDPSTVPSLGLLTANCARSLWRELESERSDWRERYRVLSAHRPGDLLEIDLDGQRLHGALAGFDDNGFLQLVVDGSTRSVGSGDVLQW